MDSTGRNRLADVAQLAEIIAAVAVVISLVYVGAEISQNTSAIQLSNAQAAYTLGHDWDAWLQDEGFAETYVIANEDFASLSPAQSVQIGKWIGEGINIWEFVFTSHQKGLVDDDVFGAWDRYFVSELATKESWRRVWSESRHGYIEGFRAHVDQLAPSP